MKRFNLLISLMMLAFLLLTACSTEVEVTRVVTEKETVIETVVVEGTPEVQEVEVTVEVEKVVVATPDRATDPRFGGTFRPATNALIQFDMTFCSDGPSSEAMSNIHGYLYRMQDLGEPIPDLAVSWEWEDDTHLVFHLREGVMFHDGNEVFPEGEGREVTADDVVYSMERWVNAEGSKMTADVKNFYVSIEALDRYTVRLTLNAPTAGLFTQTRGLSSLAVVPHEAVEHYGEDFGMNPIGSGPFEFVEYVPDDHLLLQRNEDYWMACFLDAIEYRIIPESTVSLIALESGDVDFVSGLPAADEERIFNDDRFTKFFNPGRTPAMIWFPTGIEDFQDKGFRQAIAWAIDHQVIGPAIGGVTVEDSCGVMAKGHPGYVDDMCEKYFPFDPEGSKELLAGLGWTDSDGDGVLDKDGQPMEEITVTTFNYGDMYKVLEVVVTRLREIGIPAEPELLEFGTWADTYIKCETPQMNVRQLMMWVGCGNIGGLSQCWSPTGPFVKCLGFPDPKVFELTAEADSTIDPKEHDALLQEASERIFGEYHVINVTGPIGALMASGNYVHDYGSRYGFDNICTLENNVWLDDEAPGK